MNMVQTNQIMLTKQEQELLDAIDSDVVSDWNIEVDKSDYDDSLDQLAARLATMSVANPTLQELAASVAKEQTLQAMTTVILEHDFSAVTQEDIAEFFFVLGPKILTLYIQVLIGNIRTEEDVHLLQAYATIRSFLFGDHA